MTALVPNARSSKKTLALQGPSTHATQSIGLETGQLSNWLIRGLRRRGLPVVCTDVRHAKAALNLQINKTDANDAHGLAQIVRTGWFRDAHAAQSGTVESVIRTIRLAAH